MQSSQINRLKSLSNNVATALVGRFTPISSSAGADGLTTFFQVITRMIIYLGFASFFIGCITPCTHFMHNIQKIWVHIYVAALTVPSILRYCLTGFRECQDQNITIHPTEW